jgi:L-amino acid N-acyltransferase YncA
MTLTVREATVADAPAITRIYNDGIASRQATLDIELCSVEEIGEDLRADADTHPTIVVADGDDVVGFAWSSVYLKRACYARISEFSVYVAPHAQHRGAGRLALGALIERCEQLGFWKLTSRIFTDNVASRALCARLGFREVGVYRRHGRIDGVWKDCVVVERLLAAAYDDCGQRRGARPTRRLRGVGTTAGMSARSVLVGAVAGAAGTAALDITTYADMALRGRPSSETPSTMVKNVAESAGIEPLAADDDTAKNRRSGVGALLGYVVGLGVGAAYGVIRPGLRGKVPLVVAGLAAGAAAMALADFPAAKSGATDPKTWGASGWLADAIPHALFGLTLALTFDALDER